MLQSQSEANRSLEEKSRPRFSCIRQKNVTLYHPSFKENCRQFHWLSRGCSCESKTNYDPNSSSVERKRQVTDEGTAGRSLKGKMLPCAKHKGPAGKHEDCKGQTLSDGCTK